MDFWNFLKLSLLLETHLALRGEFIFANKYLDEGHKKCYISVYKLHFKKTKS